jgi:hypothetical protein
VQDWRVTFNAKGDPIAFLERIEELCESDGADADQLLPHLPRQGYKGKPPPGSRTIVNGGVTGKGL